MKKTSCSECGEEICYTTKRPKKCDTCKKKKDPRPKAYRSRPKLKGTQGELALFGVLDEILPNNVYINHGYYSFLLSPKNQPLQLDRYYPDLRLAFEYDGKQHEQYNRFIHKSRKNFLYYQECDRIKEQTCRKFGILLIRVKHSMKITPEKIRGLIQEKDPKYYEYLVKEGKLLEDV